MHALYESIQPLQPSFYIYLKGFAGIIVYNCKLFIGIL